MNIIDLFQTFQTQDQAIEYLEKVRWHDDPVCPYCGSHEVGRHASGDRDMARWQCRRCTRAFAVTVGTLFHGTHVPLRNWFLVLALMLNAKKSASAYQIARDLDMRRPTVWSMMQRIRTAMAADPEQDRLLHGIVEADETYVGGKPRKGNRRDGDAPNKRGRGTKKTAVIGAVERGGKVVAASRSPRGQSQQNLAIEAAIEIIKDAGRTVSIHDLCDNILKKGIRLGGPKPRSVLSAYLSRSSDLKSVTRGWWGLNSSNDEEPHIEERRI